MHWFYSTMLTAHGMRYLVIFPATARDNRETPAQTTARNFDPDPRSTGFVRHDATGYHSKTIEDHYKDIAAIQLSEEVPAAIRGGFDTVRNLYLYSWYVYEFTVAAITARFRHDRMHVCAFQ